MYMGVEDLLPGVLNEHRNLRREESLMIFTKVKIKWYFLLLERRQEEVCVCMCVCM